MSTYKIPFLFPTYVMKAKKIILTLIVLLLSLGNANAQRIAIIGDSNTWLGGDNNNGKKGWNHWFCEIFKPDTCRSYARSGATWTNTVKTQLNTKENIGSLGDNNVAYNQMHRLFEDTQLKPNVVIIALGTNDLWFKSKRPHLFAKSQLNYDSKDFLATPPNKLLTLTDCVTHTIRSINRTYPKAKVVLITPAECIHVNNTELTRLADMLENIGKTLGASTIRLDKLSEIKSDKERIKKDFTYDGTHTSEKGAKSNAAIIAKELKQILDN